MSLDAAGMPKKVGFKDPNEGGTPTSGGTGETNALNLSGVPMEETRTDFGSPTTPPKEKEKESEKAPAKSSESTQKRETTSPTPSGKVSQAEVDSSILRRSTSSNKKIQCSDCGEWFTAEEWPNHKDRIRKVNVKRRALTMLQKYIALPMVDFLMWFLANIFFREVAVVGRENIPKTGPVVFYANHQNQFIDAMVLRATVGRQCRFIIAEKSLHRPIIGHFAKLMDAVPVVRPQDAPQVPGVGHITGMPECDKTGGKNIIVGKETEFSKLNAGDVLIWTGTKGQKCTAQVFQLINDTTVAVTQPISEADHVTKPTTFKISRRLDQSEMYAAVYDTLGRGEAIAIFPEGGSHDRTSLQPLKAGVALFTLGAAERNIYTKMVPVGLTYFHGDRFRSRVHVEIGKPILPPEELVEKFGVQKREATAALLQKLDSELRAVTINISDWSSLKFLHSFRRLYQPSTVILQNRDYLRLTRRLSILVKEHEDEPEFQDFRSKVENYMDYCNALLIRDAQAATLANLRGNTISMALLTRRLVMLCVMAVILVPWAVVSLPIGLIARQFAEDHSRTALAASTVKVVAADVKASYKVVTCFALIPIVFSIISSLVWWYHDLRTATTVFFSLPMMCYVSLLISQEFVLEVRAALPLLMSILSKHKQFLKLHDRREKLVNLARDIVNKYDPKLEDELNSLPQCAVDNSIRQPSLFSLRTKKHM